MKIKNNLEKFFVLFALVLLMIPIANVHAIENVTEPIGDTEATIKGNNYEIKTESKQIILRSGAKVELTGNANNYKIVVEENAINVSIILNNYTAEDNSGWNSTNMIELKNGSSVTLTLIGNNTLSAGPESSAIRVPINTSLVIDGDGTLHAIINNGGSWATSAVIGSSYNEPFGNITINSGNIYTSHTGGGKNTGIGSGDYQPTDDMSGTITLNGGNIHTDLLGSTTNSDKVILKGNGSAIVYTDEVSLNSDEFNGIIFDSDEKKGSVKGNVTLKENMDIPSDAVLTVEEDASLNIPSNVTVTNNGSIVNNGTINNTGNLQNSGEIQNTGSLNSSTEIENVSGNSVELIFYNVTINVGNGGTISSEQYFSIKHGESLSFNILPDDGYKIKSIIVNDINKTDNVVDSKFTLSNITEDTIITVEFEKTPDPIIDTYYDVTIKVGKGGVITPGKPFSIKHGESTTFSVLPDNGYKIKFILINDIDKTNDLVDNKLTLSNITENIIITAEFEKIPDTSEDTVVDDVIDEMVDVVDINHHVTINVGNGGVVNPNNSFIIKHGESATFDISPDNGYKIKSIIVNDIDKTNDVIDSKLTLSNITEDIIITVEFEKLADTSKYTVNTDKPETYDNILFFVVLELVSLIIITLIIYYKKYKNNKTR